MRTGKLRYFLGAFFLFYTDAMGYASSIDFMPIVSNYSQSSYSGGLQNWSVTQSDNGQMFFGNQNEMLSFDGFQWNNYNLPSHSIVRSVLADKDRIYVGTYTDFGFFKRNNFGRYVYTSLWPKNYTSHNDEIWKIVKAPNNHIYFQSFCSWFDYDGKKVVSHYDPTKLPLGFFRIGDRIYVQLVNQGLCLLENGRYVPIAPRSAYNNDDIVGMVPLHGNSILCITAKSGLFILGNGRFTPWHTNIDADLRNFQVNKAVLVGDKTLAIGTILNGIYSIDLATGQLLWQYNMVNGLQNNTVLGLMTDKNGNLWAALDNGIAIVHTSLPIDVMRTSKLGLPIGMVYGMYQNNSEMYIATNQSLWRYDLNTKEIKQVQNTNGQNWYITSFGNQIFAGGNLSTMSVEGDVGIPIPGTYEGGTCIKPFRLNGQDVLIESGYSNFKVYRKQADKWTFSNPIKGFQAPILEFEIDNSGNIWAAHFSKGIYKITLSTDLSQVAHMQYYGAPTSNGIPSKMHVMRIRGRVVFAYQDSLYTYDDLNNRIVAYQGQSHTLPQGISSSIAVDNATFWVADKDAFLLYRHDGEKLNRLLNIPYKMFGLDVNTSGVSQYVYGNNNYFFLNNGIGRYRMGKSIAFPHFPLTVAQVTSNRSGNEVESVACEGNTDNKIHSDNIRIELSYPNYNHQEITFRYTLQKPGNDMSSEQDNPIITFNSLNYGSYTLEASCISTDGEVLATTVYKFRRIVPFYFTIWAFLIYALVIFLVIMQITRWRANKIISRNQHKAEEELMRQNLKMLEQQQIISAQQQIIMQDELSSKGKELASMAFEVVTQHNNSEMLREELMEKKRKGTLSDKDFKDLLTNTKGGNTDKAWDIFQQNFDLIHKNFFRNLRTRYPNLTPTDLKFCALLRLNLNTKEIANYTNLSVRGVEGARYRLRKKFGIEGDASLTDFLIDMK